MANIWSTARRGRDENSATTGPNDKRTEFERDYDRLVFSSPLRRMADKTQVFPLDPNDGVRTRLTHSYEVSNLARSIANRLIRNHKDKLDPDFIRHAPVILAAVGLAHDLGNPPFGHQGEVAIRRWFQSKDELLIFNVSNNLEKTYKEDFLNFEGNAQTLRLLTRLQVSLGGHGLDLTAATLAALMKYTVPAEKTSRDNGASYKKPGFMMSEQHVIDWIREKTGLKEGQRHPLTWLMEACDDIAYSVLDIEDAMKKEIFSPDDLLSYLNSKPEKSDFLNSVCQELYSDFDKANKLGDYGYSREVKISYFRTRVIEKLMEQASEAFINGYDQIMNLERSRALFHSDNEGGKLCEIMKEYARENAYRHRSVLRDEHRGSLAISVLMDFIWGGIYNRKNESVLSSQRNSAFEAYVYNLISKNYRREFESESSGLPVRYRELQLLTDMVSGMSDGYAINLYSELKSLRDA